MLPSILTMVSLVSMLLMVSTVLMVFMLVDVGVRMAAPGVIKQRSILGHDFVVLNALPAPFLSVRQQRGSSAPMPERHPSATRQLQQIA